MKKVTWVGTEGFEEYHGTDGDQAVDIEAGETVEVSDEKADQLVEDFGKLVKVAAANAKVGKAKAAADAEDEE